MPVARGGKAGGSCLILTQCLESLVEELCKEGRDEGTTIIITHKIKLRHSQTIAPSLIESWSMDRADKSYEHCNLARDTGR